MNERLISILLDGQRNYNYETLHYVRSLEEKLHFNEFSNTELKELYNSLLRASKSIIIYDENRNIILEWNKNKDCMDKGNVVFETNHSSIYPLMMYSISFEKQDLLNKKDYLPIFGAYPLFIENKLKYVVAIDSKDPINDFVTVINKIKNLEIPFFTGYIPEVKQDEK